MINITFPDGNVRQYAPGTTAMDVAKSISEGLARNVLAANVNGEVRDLARVLAECERLMYLVFHESNFYNAIAVFYYDLVIGAVATSLFIPVAIINTGPTRGDHQASLRIDAPLGATLSAVMRALASS